VRLVNPTGLPLDELLPRPALFTHRSSLHEVAHVARVMIHGFLLTELTGHRDRALPLWAAVFVHDLARKGDGVCHQHGPDAAELVTTSTELRERLCAGGVAEADLEAVAVAVRTHSHGELPKDHPHYVLTALLKDADGLDRVRLGDLDPSYFRFEETKSLVPFAGRLFKETEPEGAGSMSRVWSLAEGLIALADT
jgi:hypothetical protein